MLSVVPRLDAVIEAWRPVVVPCLAGSEVLCITCCTYIGSDIRWESDLKPIRWLGTTRDDIREQRRAVRNEFGQQLFRAQMGLMPNTTNPCAQSDRVRTRYESRTPMALLG